MYSIMLLMNILQIYILYIYTCIVVHTHKHMKTNAHRTHLKTIQSFSSRHTNIIHTHTQQFNTAFIAHLFGRHNFRTLVVGCQALFALLFRSQNLRFWPPQNPGSPDFNPPRCARQCMHVTHTAHKTHIIT